MEIQRLSNLELDKSLNEEAWKELSETYQWTEKMLEANQENVDWKLISQNDKMLWTVPLVERFKDQLDWDVLSNDGSNQLLNRVFLYEFLEYWDWEALSANHNLKLSYSLIDEFLELWDWHELVDRYNDPIYSTDFYERYKDYIPTDVQRTHLWDALLEERIDKIRQNLAVL